MICSLYNQEIVKVEIGRLLLQLDHLNVFCTKVFIRYSIFHPSLSSQIDSDFRQHFKFRLGGACAGWPERASADSELGGEREGRNRGREGGRGAYSDQGAEGER